MEVIFTRESIVPPPLELHSREIGACVEFWGIVREQEGSQALAGLEYEAYEAMARREFARIYEELRDVHAVEKITLVHRLGWVPVAEPSLFVRVLAKHRGPALACCGVLIDRMKEDVPIWKMPGPQG